MTPLRVLASRLAALFGLGRRDTDLQAEIQTHLDLLAEEYRRRGLSPAEARLAARREFGGIAQTTETYRDQRGFPFVDTLVQDLRLAIRMLRRTPVVSTVAILSLALGIGANTAIFSLVNSLLLRALPVDQPERLAIIQEEGRPGSSWTNPIWEEIRDHVDLFDGTLAWSTARFDLAQGGEAQMVEGLWASGRFFDVLGVPAIVGRTFTAEDDRRGGGPDGPVAVIGFGFWQRQFGGAPDAVGRRISIDRVPFTIVGITPPGFFGPDVGRTFDVVIPIGTEPLLRGKESNLDERWAWWLNIIVRVKPGQSLETAEAAFRALQPQVRLATLPTSGDADGLGQYLTDAFSLEPAATGRSPLRTRYQRPLLTILVVVGLVLLIACANIANLQLARAVARRHELSVRLALGASGWRVARQLLVESLVLASSGAALGMVLARWSSAAIVAQLSTRTNLVFLDLTPDWRVLGFTTAVAVLTALVFGTAPALRASRVAPIGAMKEHGRTQSDAGGGIASGLVVVQVALSLLLVVAAGLFGRTFASLATLRLGYESDRVLFVRLSAPRASIAETGRGALFENVRRAVAGVPGVAEAATSRMTPINAQGWNGLVRIDGAPPPSGRPQTFYNAVAPRWFAAVGTPMLAGRDFTDGDRHETARVAIVNQAFARRFNLGDNPVGRRVLRQEPSGDTVPTEIVGYVADAVYRSLREGVLPTMYLPFAQEELNPSSANIHVRVAAGSPTSLARSIAAAIGTVNRDLVVTSRPLTELVSAALVQERLVAMLSGFFAALALLLAGLGLYGVTAYAVSRRRAEIGIRIALGAAPAGVVRLVLRRVMILIAFGVLAGAGLSLWATKFVATLLYRLEPRDPATLAGAALTLAAIGAVAGWLPARRAAGIDPAEVLRDA